NYFKLILKNPFRNKTRTSLAIIGIAVGIMVIVALGMVTGGLQSSTQSTLKAGAAEITVMQAGSNGFGSTGSINNARIADIKNISGVKDTTGTLSTNTNLNGSSSDTSTQTPNQGSGGGFGQVGITVTGIDSSKLNLEGIDNVNGIIYNNNANEIILGKTASESLNKTIGDTITLYNQNFKITGIYETGNMMTDRGVYMSLTVLQNLTSNPDKISNILVKVDDNANVTSVSQTIKDTYPNELSTITAADQANRMNNALGTINSASWAISLLAIFIGGVGVINTMIMSVYDRTREIGVLKAVGWRSRRILGMILGESIVLTLIAAVLGTIVGIIIVEGGLMILGAGNSIKPVFTLDLLIRAFGIDFLVGIIGGIYPAYRASRLAPTEALRYE
ncbi:MAG: ABC transporter permease, partial [Methanobacterium sp.]